MIELIYHGHFYQPPRENPWTDVTGREAGAAPFANWNARILAECYRPNAFAPIAGSGGEIESFVNNYAHLSFNFGPTLLRWIEGHDPLTLQRLREADAQSAAARNGHGNALAQVYNHSILPLAPPADRRTQIRWGLAEFHHRFGRDAEGMWLPETAANADVLEDLIECGVHFTVLAPWQARRVRSGPDAEWEDVAGGRVDTTRPYRFRHRDGSGRSMALFFYDGELSRSVAFGEALASSEELARRVVAAAHGTESGNLVHVAVDGETAGHHRAWGDRSLSFALTRSLPEAGVVVTNYGDYLERNPPTWEVELDHGPEGEGTSWSCHHGVGRWIRDCSCAADPGRGWSQQWRGPLREALDLLRTSAAEFFVKQAARLLRDPWAARDDYVQVLLDPGESSRDALIARHAVGPLAYADRVRALTLLEMQHQLLLMYASCAWFFDDVAGIEPTQSLRYAARAVDLWRELGGRPPEYKFRRALARAKSNVKESGSAADVYERHAVTRRVAAETVLAKVAAAAALAGGPDRGRTQQFEFEVVPPGDEATLPGVEVRLTHERTGRILHRRAEVLDAGGDTAQVRLLQLAGEKSRGKHPGVETPTITVPLGVDEAASAPTLARRWALATQRARVDVSAAAFVLGQLAQKLLESEGATPGALAAAEASIALSQAGRTGFDRHRLQEACYVAALRAAEDGAFSPQLARLCASLGFAPGLIEELSPVDPPVKTPS